MDGPKENANPTVLSVNQDNFFSVKRQKALQCSAIAAISGEDVSSPRSVPDRAVLQALVDAATASHGKNVSLLRNIGMVIPEDPSRIASVYREPLFLPSRPRTLASASAKTTPAATADSTSVPEAAPSRDPIEADEIFEIVKNVQDPEHPLTLEQLGVVSREQISVGENSVDVRFTPTIPHCSMATLIGLCLRVKLFRSLSGNNSQQFKVTVRIEPGTHQSEHSVNKQLADKERVAAALENRHLAGVVNRCIGNGMTGNMSPAV